MTISDIFNENSKQTAWIEHEIQCLIIRLALAELGSPRQLQLLKRLRRVYEIVNALRKPKFKLNMTVKR